jgi:hypothetical protein
VYGAVETGLWGMAGSPAIAILMGISGGLVFGGSASTIRALAIVVDIPWWLDDII